VDLVELGLEHKPLFATFKCRAFRKPWTEPVEDAIRTLLGGELERGTVRAVGLLADQELVGLIAWSVGRSDPSSWQVFPLAVAEGRQGRGYGRLLKDHLVRVATAEGIRSIESLVHKDNVAMIKLNRSIGAVIVSDPTEASKQHVVCEILITPTRSNAF
jgi:ribosomal protein S18 acetylase RimI-like enzyme